MRSSNLRAQAAAAVEALAATADATDRYNQEVAKTIMGLQENVDQIRRANDFQPSPTPGS